MVTVKKEPMVHAHLVLVATGTYAELKVESVTIIPEWPALPEQMPGQPLKVFIWVASARGAGFPAARYNLLVKAKEIADKLGVPAP